MLERKECRTPPLEGVLLHLIITTMLSKGLSHPPPIQAVEAGYIAHCRELTYTAGNPGLDSQPWGQERGLCEYV